MGPTYGLHKKLNKSGNNFKAVQKLLQLGLVFPHNFSFFAQSASTLTFSVNLANSFSQNFERGSSIGQIIFCNVVKNETSFVLNNLRTLAEHFSIREHKYLSIVLVIPQPWWNTPRVVIAIGSNQASAPNPLKPLVYV